MSVYPNFDIQLEHGERLVASVGGSSFGGQWLRLDVDPKVAGASIGLFIPGDKARAERIVAAINAAWNEPAERPVPGGWTRPVSPGLRAEHVLPEWCAICRQYPPELPSVICARCANAATLPDEPARTVPCLRDDGASERMDTVLREQLARPRLRPADDGPEEAA